MREPRNIQKYTNRDQAAQGLEDLARDIRSGSETTLVRWYANVSFWDPAWKTQGKKQIKESKGEGNPKAGDGTCLENKRG